jgi:hypothetical protein
MGMKVLSPTLNKEQKLRLYENTVLGECLDVRENNRGTEKITYFVICMLFLLLLVLRWIVHIAHG